MSNDPLIISGAEPIDLRHEADAATPLGRRAVLLIHGFGDTPQTLRYLADDLYTHGYDVRVPLLPGHGRSVVAFDRVTHDEWISAAKAELVALRSQYSWVALGGLSMGGAISAILAAEVSDLPALCLIAPYVGMPLYARVAAACYRLLTWYNQPLSADAPTSIHDPDERAKNLAYGGLTAHAVHELAAIVKLARRALPSVVTPTLIIQSKHDNRIPPHVATWAFDTLGAQRKRIVLTEVGGHIITVDYGRERVFSEVRAWLGSGPGTVLPKPDTVSDLHSDGAHDTLVPPIRTL